MSGSFNGSLSGSGNGVDDDDDSVADALQFDHLEKELHADYAPERDSEGHTMANYLAKLNAKYGNLLALRADPHWMLLERVFPSDRVVGVPRVFNNPGNDEKQRLLVWADALFNTVPAWPKPDNPKREERMIKILHAVRRGVKYCTKEGERAKYLVKLGPVLMRGPLDELLDTKSLAARYRSRQNYLVGGIIWVLGKDDRFYTHASKHGRIHHSTFFGGEAIRAGGEWVVEAGKLTRINGESGHYKPDASHFIEALTLLVINGVMTIDDKVVQVWPPKGGADQLISFAEFRWNPAQYRIYK